MGAEQKMEIRDLEEQLKQKRCIKFVDGFRCGSDYLAVYGFDRSPDTYAESLKLRDLR